MPYTFPRRDFLRLAGLATAGAAFGGWPAWARAFTPQTASKGETYTGRDLRYIGMPVGGILCGQVYLGGDGQLWLWDIFNQIKLGIVEKNVRYGPRLWNASEGANYLEPPLPRSPLVQYFSLTVDGKERRFREKDWTSVSFEGNYPVGQVNYEDPDCPIAAMLTAFSPFVPLDAERSGYPAVVMQYRLRNRSDQPVKVELKGAMENVIGLHSVMDGEGTRIVQTSRDRSQIDYSIAPMTWSGGEERPPIVFESWSRPDYAGWHVEGEAFGRGPLGINLQKNPPKEWRGAKSYRPELRTDHPDLDGMTGRLISRPFRIGRRFIAFWINGGNFPTTACMNLVVDGKIVRSATGLEEERPRRAHFRVSEFEGKEAHLEIVDSEKAPWGQIGVGQISFLDTLEDEFRDSGDIGTMSLAFLEPGAGDRAVPEPGNDIHATTPQRPMGELMRAFTMDPGESRTVEFVIAWRFPNLGLAGLGSVGNHYATRFRSSGDVVRELRRDKERLWHQTFAWKDAWYGGSMPSWFLNRTMMGTAILATMTCHRFGNGRFYGWEGVGGCEGTCGHVWAYAQSVARMFPSLERSRREDVDYGLGFDPKTGVINFRSEFGFGYAADAQCGYVLRTYREHQMSRDDRFLRRVYSRMKKALGYLIERDGDENGVLEGKQHNTLDVDIYGPSSWLTSYYLAALRAGEEMAREVGDEEFVVRCRKIFARGAKGFVDTFWNGEYFVHRPDPTAPPDSLRYGDGCEIDQLMGQAYAAQLGLGRIVDARHTREALRAISRNNLKRDAGGISPRLPNARWYAMPGEPGTLLCTFPHGNRSESVGPKPVWANYYYDECWTGTEHQLAGLMISEGLVDEGLAVIEAVHDRHHPSRRNPYNEVEYSDHYARSMSSFGAYLAMCGYEYHGPKGHLGFAPKISPEDFRCAFTAAEGWGVYTQKGNEYAVSLSSGRLKLKTFSFESMPHGKVQAFVGTKEMKVTASWSGNRCLVQFDKLVTLHEGEGCEIRVA